MAHRRQRPAGTEDAQRAREVAWPFRIGLAVLVIAVFWNGLDGVFLFDDFASIHQNTSIRPLSPAAFYPPARGESVSGRPLVNVSLAINYALAELNVRNYHVANLLLHLGCALLAFAIIRRLLRISFATHGRPANAIAFGIVALWAVHPLQSEVVDYVIARTESLSALFYLLCIYWSIRAYEAPRGSWSIAVAIAAMMGALSKESIVTVPVAVMLIDRALLFPSFADAFRARRSLYAGLCASWLVVAGLAIGSPRANSAGFGVRSDAAADVSFSGYLLNQAEIVPHYFTRIVWPVDLVLDYGLIAPVTVADALPYAALILAVIGITAWLWMTRQRAGLPFMLCVLLLAPTTLVPIVSEVGAERRMYLPGLVVIAAIAIATWRMIPRQIMIGITAIAIAAASWLTIERNAEYASTYEMWRTVVDRRPHGRAYMNLAVAANESGRSSEVLPLLRDAVRDYPDAEHALGERLYQERRYSEAIEHLTRFLELRGTHFQAEAAKQLLIRSWTDLAIQESEAGRLVQAHQAFLKALSLDPTNPGLRRNAEVSAATLGNQVSSIPAR